MYTQSNAKLLTAVTVFARGAVDERVMLETIIVSFGYLKNVLFIKTVSRISFIHQKV